MGPKGVKGCVAVAGLGAHGPIRLCVSQNVSWPGQWEAELQSTQPITSFRKPFPLLLEDGQCLCPDWETDWPP